MTRSKFSPSSLYTALQLEQIVLKAREVMVLIMLNFWVLKFFKGISVTNLDATKYCFVLITK